MSFILPIRPSRSSKPPKTPNPIRTTRTLQPPPESPRRRPSLAMRAGVTKRRSSILTTFNAPSMSFFEAMFGDDFPDAFAHDGRSCKSSKTLLDLPAELLKIVCQHLSGLAIKHLRLMSRDLAEKVELRIDRVYVSPNRANLDCLNNVLDRPRYSVQVKEIVWDDAQLDQIPTFDIFRDRIKADEAYARLALEDHLSTLLECNTEVETEYKSIGIQDCLRDDGNLTDIGKAILLNANDERSKNIIVGRAVLMSIEDSYDLYQKLYQDEREIIKRGWDENALFRALVQLPNLRRVTVTTEVWRPWTVMPSYDTPFRRALPAGFRKPSVRPWSDWTFSETFRGELIRDGVLQNYRTEERGYSILMSLLASKPALQLRELVVDTGCENIGLPPNLFVFPKLDQPDTLQVFSTLPLKRLQLSIVEENGQMYEDPPGTLLGSMLSVLPDLEDLDLKYNVPFPHGEAWELFDVNDIQMHCPRLKNLALRLVRTSNTWLFEVITSLENLNCVLLDRIHIGFSESGGDIFHRLQQRYTDEPCRGPRFTWIDALCDHVQADSRPFQTSRWLGAVDEELDAFLYHGGEYPLMWLEREIGIYNAPRLVIRPSSGWIVDARDPTFRIRNTEASASRAIAMRSWPVCRLGRGR